MTKRLESLPRNQQRYLYDTLSEEDKKWSLCRGTGASYQDLLSVAARVEGNAPKFAQALGYGKLQQPKSLYSDYGWWGMLCDWLKMYIPQWEDRFRHVTTNITKYPELDQAKILNVAAKALNISEEVLLHFAEHREEIELFLAAQRSTLGTLAEAKLWELVMGGDAATIRWLLPRIKSDIFGDKLQTEPGDTPRVIRIIEVTNNDD